MAGDLSPGREAILVGVDLAEELVESFDGDLRPALFEAEERGLIAEAGAVVGLLSEEAIRG